MSVMCIKCESTPNYQIIIVGRSRRGKTVRQAQFIVMCDDYPDDFEISEYFKDWAEYFYKNRPVTKADLREVLYGVPQL